jgi:hypothetical protein
LRVVFLSLAQGYQEVLAVFGCVLGSVLDDCLFSLAQLLGKLSQIFFRVRLLQFNKDLLQKAGLLWLRLFLILLDWDRLLYLGLLFGFVSDDALNQLLTDLCNSMIVVGPIGTVNFEEGELWFMLLSLNEYFFELGAIECDVLCCLL